MTEMPTFLSMQAAASKDPITASEQSVATALGGQGGAGQQQISEALAKMTRPQIYEIMSQMKSLIQQNPAQVHHTQIQAPQPSGDVTRRLTPPD